MRKTLQLDLFPARADHLDELKSWFPDRAAAQRWGGPGLRWPLEDAAFLQDIRWGQMPSWVGLDEAGAMLGFGQYYESFGRCRLARLAVAPGLRGRGVGRRFIGALLERGQAELGVDGSCLFVIEDNAAALRCYRSLGFVERPYPPGQEHYPAILYMERAVRG